MVKWPPAISIRPPEHSASLIKNIRNEKFQIIFENCVLFKLTYLSCLSLLFKLTYIFFERVKNERDFSRRYLKLKSMLFSNIIAKYKVYKHQQEVNILVDLYETIVILYILLLVQLLTKDLLCLHELFVNGRNV